MSYMYARQYNWKEQIHVVDATCHTDDKRNNMCKCKINIILAESKVKLILIVSHVLTNITRASLEWDFPWNKHMLALKLTV